LRTASGAKTARTAGSVGATSPSPKRGWPTASVFGLLHLPNPWLTPATFCGGLLWAWDCQRAPNLWALAFSHSLMTVVLVTTVPYSALGGMRVGYGYFL
jgi:hypothetical protein